MSITISSINYFPVKSVSFQTIKSCEIKKNIGIVGDRIFAFSKGLDLNQAQLFEKNIDQRRGKWNKILTLKNSHLLNKYNFLFDNDKLILTQNNNEIVIPKIIEIVYGLRNFIGNANKFSRKKIFINLKSDSEKTNIKIEDDGEGFPKDILHKIGEPYLKSFGSLILIGSSLLGIHMSRTSPLSLTSPLTISPVVLLYCNPTNSLTIS